jgi:O-antigen ligase
MSSLDQPHQRATLAEVLFYATILALPFEELITVGGGTITKWIGLAFVAASLSAIRTFYNSFPLVFLGYLMYVAVGVAGDLVRIPLSLTLLNQVMGPVLTCVFMIAAYNLAANRSLRRLMFVLWLSAALFAVFQYFGVATGATSSSSQVVEGESVDRISALATDPNFVACFMSLAVIPGVLAFSGALPLTPCYWFLSLLGALLAAGGIIMTGSRGGLLALVMGIASVLFVTRNWVVRLKVICVAFGVLGILSAAVLHDPLFRARLEASLEKRDTANREDIWQDSLALFTQHPIFGFGNLSSVSELGRFRGEGNRCTHNVLLSVLLATGGAGCLAFLCFYLTSAGTAWRHRKSGMGIIVFPWFLIALVGSLSLNLERGKWYWLITALALAVPKAQAQEARKVTRFARALGDSEDAASRRLSDRDTGLWLKDGIQPSGGIR